MQKLEESYQVIDRIDRDNYIRCVGYRWIWHPDDLESLDEILPKKLKMKIPKEKSNFKFDPKELD